MAATLNRSRARAPKPNCGAFSVSSGTADRRSLQQPASSASQPECRVATICTIDSGTWLESTYDKPVAPVINKEAVSAPSLAADGGGSPGPTPFSGIAELLYSQKFDLALREVALPIVRYPVP